MNLFKLFNDLIPPSEDDTFQFSAAIIPRFSNHRIGKDKLENPSLLISSLSQERSSVSLDLKLQNVSVFFDLNCKIRQNNDEFERSFTTLNFIGHDNSLKQYFLKLCTSLVQNLGNFPSRGEVLKEVTNFIELFRLAAEAQTKTIQGLWAELFLIAESKDPVNLLRHWHTLPEEKFDFSNGEERIEVKSYSGDLRIHSFSIDQLNPPTKTKTIIASTLVKQAVSGKSVEVLQAEIEFRIALNFELLERLRFQIALTLGNSIVESWKIKFDHHLALDTLRFYRVDDIPKIEISTVPRFVSDVRFKSDLSNVTSVLSTNEIQANGGLFASLF